MPYVDYPQNANVWVTAQQHSNNRFLSAAELSGSSTSAGAMRMLGPTPVGFPASVPDSALQPDANPKAFFGQIQGAASTSGQALLEPLPDGVPPLGRTVHAASWPHTNISTSRRSSDKDGATGTPAMARTTSTVEVNKAPGKSRQTAFIVPASSRQAMAVHSGGNRRLRASASSASDRSGPLHAANPVGAAALATPGFHTNGMPYLDLPAMPDGIASKPNSTSSMTGHGLVKPSPLPSWGSSTSTWSHTPAAGATWRPPAPQSWSSRDSTSGISGLSECGSGSGTGSAERLSPLSMTLTPEQCAALYLTPASETMGVYVPTACAETCSPARAHPMRGSSSGTGLGTRNSSATWEHVVVPLQAAYWQAQNGSKPGSWNNTSDPLVLLPAVPAADAPGQHASTVQEPEVPVLNTSWLMPSDTGPAANQAGHNAYTALTWTTEALPGLDASTNAADFGPAANGGSAAADDSLRLVGRSHRDSSWKRVDQDWTTAGEMQATSGAAISAGLMDEETLVNLLARLQQQQQNQQQQQQWMSRGGVMTMAAAPAIPGDPAAAHAVQQLPARFGEARGGRGGRGGVRSTATIVPAAGLINGRQPGPGAASAGRTAGVAQRAAAGGTVDMEGQLIEALLQLGVRGNVANMNFGPRN
mmetsp:Transcript_32924/g.72725  ORF Transcript_32924/g.72725 Transcript_32924/m.72725 type:complete len:646 (+) Transcript_32924:214-2151(+)